MFLIHFPSHLVVVQSQWGIQMRQPVMSRRHSQLELSESQLMVQWLPKCNQHQENMCNAEEVKLCHRYQYMESLENFRVEFQRADHLHLLSKSNANWCRYRHICNKKLQKKREKKGKKNFVLDTFPLKSYSLNIYPSVFVIDVVFLFTLCTRNRFFVELYCFWYKFASI